VVKTRVSDEGTSGWERYGLCIAPGRQIDRNTSTFY